MRTNPATTTRIGALICAVLAIGTLFVSAVNLPSGRTVMINSSASSTDVEIQKALDQLPSEGGTVMLAPGVYTIHHPIHLNRNNLTLRGSGDTTVLRLADRADCPVVIMGSIDRKPARAVTDLRLAYLSIDGNRSHQMMEEWPDPINNSGIQNNGIMIQAVSNSTVDQVVAAHCRSGGLVTANGTRGLTVSDFTAFDNQYDGLACYRTEDCVFTRLNLHDNQAAGISLDLDFNHNVISDSILSGNDLGIFMRKSSNNEFRNVSIARSHHDGVFMAQWGVNTTGGWRLLPETECAGNHFASLDIHDCAGVAFRVHDAACVNNVIEDGVFSGNLNGGVVQAAANLVHIRDLLNGKTSVE